MDSSPQPDLNWIILGNIYSETRGLYWMFSEILLTLSTVQYLKGFEAKKLRLARLYIETVRNSSPVLWVVGALGEGVWSFTQPFRARPHVVGVVLQPSARSKHSCYQSGLVSAAECCSGGGSKNPRTELGAAFQTHWTLACGVRGRGWEEKMLCLRTCS